MSEQNELSAEELAELFMAGSDKAATILEELPHPESAVGFLTQALLTIYLCTAAHESVDGLSYARELINRADNNALDNLSNFLEWQQKKKGQTLQ